MEDFIETLIQHHVDVYLVSGGFRIMIEPIARQLGIPKNHIYANTLYFDETTGLYLGFDDTEPMSHDYGKRHALEQIQQLHNYQTIIMIGDGAMDAQAKPPASAFIGYGGCTSETTGKCLYWLWWSCGEGVVLGSHWVVAAALAWAGVKKHIFHFCVCLFWTYVSCTEHVL